MTQGSNIPSTIDYQHRNLIIEVRYYWEWSHLQSISIESLRALTMGTGWKFQV